MSPVYPFVDIDAFSSRSRAVRWYKIVLRLFPARFLLEAEPELTAWFAAAWRDAGPSGLAKMRVLLLITLDFLKNLPAEWLTAPHAPTQPAYRGASPVETLWQDMRYALRTPGSARLVTVVAMLTIAIGVGATTTMLSVANALLVRPPAGVVDPGRLVTVHSLSQSGSSFHSFSYQDFEDLAAAKGGLQSLAAYGMLAAGLRAGDEPQLVAGMLVSGDYFRTLGTRTELGRFFSAEENREGGQPVVVLSDALWRRRFAADPAILGRTVVINGQPLTVIGVAQPDFHGHFAGISISLWAPLALNDVLTHRADLHNRGASWLELVGRLGPGATPGGVATALSAVSARDGRAAGLDWDRGVDVRHYLPVPASAALPVGGFLGLLVILAGFVLLIASANVGTVLLARAATQNRAMAVRLALGATRGRLLRQRLTESVALFVVGGTMGTGLAYAATWALSRIEPPTEVPLALDFHPDPLVLAITLIVTLVAGLTFGLAPALQGAEADPALLLREGASTLRMTRTRLRGALVGGQVAATACLLVTAGLFARGLSRAGDLHPGFEPSGVRVMSVDLSVRNYDDARKVAFVETLERRAAALPGVVSVATTDLVPLNLSNQETEIALPERPAQPDVGLFQVDFTGVTSGYFATMRIPLLQGRTFGPADREGAAAVAIVNQTLAKRLWPGENPIGKRINYGSFTQGTPTEIIGVAADAKYRSLGEDPLPMVYVPMAQQPRPRVTLLVRSAAGAAASPRALRDAVREFDPDLPVGQEEMLESVIGVALLPNRIAVIVAAAFGATGLQLASLGLYGLLAYRVQSRRKEIGIRMALGATAAQIRGLVIGEGVRVTAAGVLAGLLLAGVIGRFLGSMLFGVSPLDPATYAGIAGLLVLVAWFAAAGPTRRALRTEPAEVLRHE